MRSFASFVLVAAIVGSYGRASVAAPSAGQNEAIAEQLFEEALAFEKAGDWKSACSKYEASQRVGPANGTLLKLGICHSQIGLTATGYGELILARTAAKKDGRPDRIAIADEWIAKLEPHLSRLVITFAPGADAPNVVVVVDGKDLDRGVVGSQLPIDPGDHALSVTAPGKKSWSTNLHVNPEGDKKSVVVPVLEDAPIETKDTTTSSTTPQPTSSNGKKIAGWVLVGGGAAMGALGAYFTLHASSLHDDAVSMNDSDPAGAASTNDEARRALTFGRIGVGMGIVAVGIGTYLLLTSDSSASSSSSTTGRDATRPMAFAPWIGTGVGGFAMQGSF